MPRRKRIPKTPKVDALGSDASRQSARLVQSQLRRAKRAALEGQVVGIYFSILRKVVACGQTLLNASLQSREKLRSCDIVDNERLENSHADGGWQPATVGRSAQKSHRIRHLP